MTTSLTGHDGVHNMRIVTQDGTKSLPFDAVTVYISPSEMNTWSVYAKSIYDGTDYLMGVYSTKAQAVDAFRRMHRKMTDLFAYFRFPEEGEQ